MRTTRDESTWWVRRRWLPWRRRIRDVPDMPVDLPTGDDPISAVISIVLLVLAIPAIIVILALLVELLILLALLPFAVLLRILLPLPWTLEVRRRPAAQTFLGWTREEEVRVRGWRASRAMLRRLAEDPTARTPLVRDAFGGTPS